jgi:hypothetical protein
MESMAGAGLLSADEGTSVAHDGHGLGPATRESGHIIGSQWVQTPRHGDPICHPRSLAGLHLPLASQSLHR